MNNPVETILCLEVRLPDCTLIWVPKREIDQGLVRCCIISERRKVSHVAHETKTEAGKTERKEF